MANTPGAPEEHNKGTVITGVIGDDVHVIGIRLMEYALRQSGFRVVSLGPLAPRQEFIDAAIETNADALFISSLNGHGAMHLEGMRDACIEAGIGDILIYAGGQLTIRRPEWDEVRHHFIDVLKLDRIYPPSVQPDEPLRDLAADIAARRARKAGEAGRAGQ